MAQGLFQLKGRLNGKRAGAEVGVWYARKVIPAPLRSRFGGKTAFVRSTGTTDHRAASEEARRLLAMWSAEIEAARALGTGPLADLPATLAAIENWRFAECGVAAGFAADVEAALDAKFRAALPELAAAGVGALFGKPLPAKTEERAGPVQPDALAWAQAYFEDPRNESKDRGVGLPYAAGLLIARLQVAAREDSGWVSISAFDEKLDSAVAAGGLEGAIPPWVREDARKPFARAWLEVEQHREAERRRAAAILAAFDSAGLSAGMIRVPGAPDAAFEPREDDRTIGEAIAAFKVAKAAAEAVKSGRRQSDAEALIAKQHGHIFKALNELLGPDKPLRAVSRADVRDVLKLLYALPANASKLYPGTPLVEVAELAARDCREPLAPNTVRSYMIAMKGVFEFARREGWVDANPVGDFVPQKNDKIVRRAFTNSELKVVFGALAEERKRDSAKWWVPAVLAYTGARANEICQLHVEDIKSADGTAYIDLSVFDDAGRRLERRRLKTEASGRAIPIHSELIAAGFLEFVARRREAGEERLFPDLTQNVLGYYSHEASRAFGRLCDAVGLVDPSLTLHGLRHGFKDAGDAVELPEYILEALGGWGSGGSAMRKYGGRCSPARVKANAAHMERISLGDFSLGPPPRSMKQ